MLGGTPQQNKKPEEPAFEKREYTGKGVMYIFKDVAVGVDTSGKNYKDLPEIIFGPFDRSSNEMSLDQPTIPLDGVNMEYIKKCIEVVAQDSGIHKFWLYPYADDKPDEKDNREQARVRLFRKYLQITPAKSGFGYVMEI
jgi:hypothetical protein